MLEQNLENGHFQVMHKNAARGIGFQFFIALLLGLIFLYHDLPLRELLTWLGLLLILNALRVGALFYFNQHEQLQKRNHLILTVFILLLFSIGLTWGAALFYLFPHTQGMRESLVVLTLGGMALGAIPSLAPYMSIYLAYILPMLTPILIANLFKFSTDYSIFSGMILTFMIMLVITALHFRNLMMRTLSFDQKEHELVTQLSHSNAQLKLAYQKIKKISRTDPLTGLANRRFFDEILTIEWARAEREKHPLSLLFIDVDNFKIINDEFGHPEGDKYLKKLALLMQAQMRRPGDFIARIGGDEFAVILSNTPISKAKMVAENIKNAVSLYNEKNHPKKNLGLSLGLSSNAQHISTRALIGAADRYLYEAKNRGKNQVYSEPKQP